MLRRWITNSNEEVNHEEDVKGKVHLLCCVFCPRNTLLYSFTEWNNFNRASALFNVPWCINEINDKRWYGENEDKTDLKQNECSRYWPTKFKLIFHMFALLVLQYCPSLSLPNLPIFCPYPSEQISALRPNLLLQIGNPLLPLLQYSDPTKKGILTLKQGTYNGEN